jgi:hypothetical protein
MVDFGCTAALVALLGAIFGLIAGCAALSRKP